MTFSFWLVWAIGLFVSTLLGALVVRKFRDRGLAVLGVLLAVYVMTANILVPRLIDLSVFGLSFIIVTGAMTWPFTAQITDMINEIYGRKATILAAVMAYAANLIFVLFVIQSFQTPPFGPSVENEPFFRSFFGVAWRVLLASMSSYTVSNLADITIFSKIKRWAMNREKTAGNLLLYSGLRSTLSDGANMIIDSAVFYMIAFLGTMPFADVLTLTISSAIAKAIIGTVDLPFYWMFRMLTKQVKRDF